MGVYGFRRTSAPIEIMNDSIYCQDKQDYHPMPYRMPMSSLQLNPEADHHGVKRCPTPTSSPPLLCLLTFDNSKSEIHMTCCDEPEHTCRYLLIGLRSSHNLDYHVATPILTILNPTPPHHLESLSTTATRFAAAAWQQYTQTTYLTFSSACQQEASPCGDCS